MIVMDANIIAAYIILLTYICNDKKKITGIVNAIQSSGNTRRKRSDSNTKAADNVSVFLKSGRVGMAINTLKAKSNQLVSDQLLCLIAEVYDFGLQSTDNVEYSKIVGKINIENAPGYLAYFILHNNVEACTEVGRILETKLRTDNENKQKVAEEQASKKEEIDQRELRKIKKENEKVKTKNTELEKELQEHKIKINILSEENQNLHDIINEKEVVIAKLAAGKEKLIMTNKELLEESKKLDLTVKNLKKQIEELTPYACKPMKLDQQTVKEEIYFYGSKWGLPESEDYNFNIVSKELYVNFLNTLEKGLKVWVVIVEVPLQIKRIVRQYREQKNIKIFETKRDLVDYLKN